MSALTQTTTDAAFLLLGGLASAFALYLLILSLAAAFHRGYHPPRTRPRARLVVVVPAHDEATLIGRCVGSLQAQTYPADLYEVVVVADNCTDDTEAIATRAGARVMVRNEPAVRGKGPALRWAMDRILAQSPAVDALVVVDADSVADRGFLAALVQPYESGASAVQGESLLIEDGTARTALRVAAFLLVNRVRACARDALRLPSVLTGTGMLLARALLLAHPWRAFTSAEDLEYTLELRLAGVGIAFARGAVVRSPAAPTPEAAAQQELRWEGGKVHLARAWIPRLVVRALRDHRPLLLLAASDLALPPLGAFAALLLAGAAVGAAGAAAGFLSTWALFPWVIALASFPLSVFIGLWAAGAPTSAYRAMARAPLFVLAKVPRAFRLLGHRADVWVRTERAEDGRRANAVRTDHAVVPDTIADEGTKAEA